MLTSFGLTKTIEVDSDIQKKTMENSVAEQKKEPASYRKCDVSSKCHAMPQKIECYDNQPGLQVCDFSNIAITPKMLG